MAAAILSTLAAVSTNAADYPSTVLADGPLVYYRLADTPPVDVARNSGSLGAVGNGIHGPGVIHRVAGALIANGNAAAQYDEVGGAKHTYVSYLPALNPPAGSPFTIEFWAKPSVEVSDSPGPCPLFNRVSSGNRSGWVFYQRSPTTGWNFRMYNGSGGTVGADLTGGVNAQDTWTHIVAVWNGSQASLYVNGALVAGPITPTGGYNASTSAIFSVGSYDDGVQNPFNGAVDEVAFYPTALTGAQILAHYNNALNAAPAATYSSLITTDGAVEYLRLDEPFTGANIAANHGSLGVDGDGLHFPGLAHQVAGALAGDSDTAARYFGIDESSDDGNVATRIPFNPALNTSVFSFEVWAKPTVDGLGNAQLVLYNRQEGGVRTGWNLYQRASTVGWNLRMYDGVDDQRSIDITGGPYTIGQWYHLVGTFDGTTGRLYTNGVLAVSGTLQSGRTYAPNTDGIQFCVGGAANGTDEPFIGSIDEVALYSTPLSPAQILAHYQNGTNPSRTTPYTDVVTQDGAVEYLRLDEPARLVAASIGTLAGANGTYVNTTNDLAGPQPPAFAGFDSTNTASPFNGSTSYIELVNPAGLNFSGQITLEAWIQPDASQGGDAYIIAHGANDNFSGEICLRIEGDVYQVQSYTGVGHGTSFPVPVEDLGTGNWVHLVGTYDGANWNLYRNGVLVSSTPDATGAFPIANANWAIGARGRWKYGGGFPDSGEERVFTGNIDEPAIYNKALNAQQIAAHYSVGYASANPLVISYPNNVVTLTWSIGTLQEADNVGGPYTDVTPAPASPYTPAAGPTKKFYRLKF